MIWIPSGFGQALREVWGWLGSQSQLPPVIRLFFWALPRAAQEEWGMTVFHMVFSGGEHSQHLLLCPNALVWSPGVTLQPGQKGGITARGT